MIAMTEKEKKESPAFIEAKNMLPPALHPELQRLLADYKFAALKIHGTQFVSPKVVAELIKLGWRNSS